MTKKLSTVSGSLVQDHSAEMKETCANPDFQRGLDLEAEGNWNAAYHCYSTAMRSGYSEARLKVGFYYLFGMNTVKIDYAFAAFLFKQAYEDRVPDADFWYGYCLGIGKGVPRDSKMGYALTVGSQHFAAQFMAGAIIGNGFQGILVDRPEPDNYLDPNPVQAQLHYHAAFPKLQAASKDSWAQHLLGLAYIHGAGVQRDSTQSFQHYLRAAAQGLADAQYNVGVQLQDGNGIELDGRRAIEYYAKAAAQGHGTATVILGWCRLEDAENPYPPEEITRMWERAAHDGNYLAQYSLGVCYQEGQFGYNHDRRKAIELYRKASKQGFGKATARLRLLEAR